MTTNTTIPASIRHRNPGAMGLGSAAKRFGAVKNNRLGTGYQIATFPTTVDGAGAQMYLLWSNSYAGMTIWDAMHKWGDGASLEKARQPERAFARTDGYVAAIEQRSRFNRDDVISKEMMEDRELAIEFCKAQAHHEAGVEYPMPHEQWVEAHDQFLQVLRGLPIPLDRKDPKPVTAPLEWMRSNLGQSRISGPANNDFITDSFKAIGSNLTSDEYAHCAAVLGRALKETGFAFVEGKPGQLARSYEDYGHALDEPEEGAIVVFWRVSPNSWQGHVAIIESWTATTITVIGANQRDPATGKSGTVSRMTVPRMGQPGSQVIAYRRPVPAVRSVPEIVADDRMRRDTVSGLSALGLLFMTVWGWAKSAVAAAGEFVGVLPEAASNATEVISTSRGLFDAAGLTFPMTLILLLIVSSIAANYMSGWKSRRRNSGALTRPPYETDANLEFETEPVDDLFETAEFEKPPSRPRKRRAKKTAAKRPRRTATKKPARRKPAAKKRRA